MNLQQALSQGEQYGERFSLFVPNKPMVGTHGDQRGFKAGHSIDFRDFREYQAGDDLRRLDWGVYARSDRLMVRQYEEEIMPQVDILVDASVSMTLGEKYARAWMFAALFSVAAKKAKFRIKVIPVIDHCEPLMESGQHPSQWDIPEPSEENDWSNFANRFVSQCTRNSMRIVISDFLWPHEPSRILEPIMSGSSSVSLIQVLSNQDLQPMQGGSIKLLDAENNEELELVLDQVHLKEYQNNLKRHLEQWRLFSQRVGIPLASFEAENWDEGQLQILLSEEIVRTD